MTGAPERMLRRLEWRVVRRLDGRVQGSYRTVFRGTGIDFAGLREYQADDDVRHIDWNVTARMDEPYVRQYLQDRELTAWLVLDQTASMNFGTHEEGDEGSGKAVVLAELAVSLARLFSLGGNRIGALLYDNARQRVIPPGSGRTHVLRIANDILAMPSAPARDNRGTDLAAMLKVAAATIRRRSLIFVISDFIGEGDWSAALGRLGQRHEVVAIRVVDPAELIMPDLGLVLVQDAETGEQFVVDSSDPLFQQRFQDQVQAREATVEAAMQAAGVSSYLVTTSDDLIEALVEMVRQSRIVR